MGLQRVGHDWATELNWNVMKMKAHPMAFKNSSHWLWKCSLYFYDTGSQSSNWGWGWGLSGRFLHLLSNSWKLTSWFHLGFKPAHSSRHIHWKVFSTEARSADYLIRRKQRPWHPVTCIADAFGRAVGDTGRGGSTQPQSLHKSFAEELFGSERAILDQEDFDSAC